MPHSLATPRTEGWTMCRLAAYLGPEISLETFLLKPEMLEETHPQQYILIPHVRQDRGPHVPHHDGSELHLVDQGKPAS